MATERQLIDVAEARGYVETFMADPILKMAANAVLNNVPRVDAVEVIRCKDCKWRQQDDVNRNFCGLGDFYCGENDFCSRAERKVEDDN